ncbi:MAG: hypothetical protein ACI4EQ_08680 [Lachnospiraceae bacterium]
MKISKRILSLILVMNLAVMSLFVCGAADNKTVIGPVYGFRQAPESEGKDISEVFPAYTLTQSDIKQFEKQLGICERMINRNVNAAILEAAVNHLDELASDIQTQSLIAEVLYYSNMQDTVLEGNYLYATEVSSELGNRYISFLEEIYNSEVPEYVEFFDEWSEVELKYLSSGSEEAVALEVRNAEIMTQTYALSGEEFENQIGSLYGEFVVNSNRLAQLSGYDNYYEYATELVYVRDYDREEREAFREYVAEYIVPIYNRSYQWYQDAYDNLDRKGKGLFRDFMYDDYDSLEENYLDEYFSSLSPSVTEGMQHIFVNDNYVTTDSRKAYQGAFTVSVYEEPFCFFGPGYQDLFTVVHEIGHYYAELCSDTDWVSYDLCETHSQGNEMLYLKFLENELPADVYDALMYYQLYYFAELIVQATLIDDFEERVYNAPDIAAYTTEDFDRVVREVLIDYGIDESDEYMYECVEWLWRNIGVSSPVYYLSYAVSAMASLNLYSQSVEDYEAAVEAYRKIQEEVDAEHTFTVTLENAGIPSVFEEESYQMLSDIFKE